MLMKKGIVLFIGQIAFFVLFVLSVHVSIGQDFSFPNNDGRTKADENRIAFKILGVSSQSHANEIEAKIQSLTGIVEVKIEYLYKCRIVVDSKVSAKSVRTILLAENVDFYFPSIDVLDESLYNNLETYRDVMVPSDFPEEPERANIEEIKIYEQAVHEWGKQNPKKYAILVELGYIKN